MRPFLCVYGHTNIDHLLALKDLPERNTSSNVISKKSYFGGTGANLATMASALGVPTALVSYVGKDLPPEFRRLMESNGVILDELVEVDGQETPTVWIATDEKEDQVAYVFQGAMANMGSYPIQVKGAKDALAIHLMTGSPDYYLKLLARPNLLRKRRGLDPAQEIHHVWDAERFQKALDFTDMLFCNRNELATALRYTGKDSPEDVLDSYRGMQVIVNTLGGQGARIYGRNEVLDVPAAKVEVVDPTGAGDAFRAGFYAGLYRGKSWLECGVLGSAAASFVVSSPGSLTSIPDWGMVEERARSLRR
ncbi:MAG TPA: carbohydrate kinase family protein [Methanomassiliicoccales archaeon]|nr:carbohydrate kinase family protein [Methanomassiliicoccales archaeon]HNX47810.1 carbohydrate kinase family protein [Methanomassiliicoccales archaeon]HPR98379.1 carbohydrate kinase family protein [Methanomassiliicoccales archaeon]